MQSLHESKGKGSTRKIITNSPYGPSRNALYGWASVFGTPAAFVARVETKQVNQRMYIGTSSLNSVPDGQGSRGGKDRTFPTLLWMYGKKFGVLEHCYPFHRFGTVEEWSEWKQAAERIPKGGSRRAGVLSFWDEKSGNARREGGYPSSMNRNKNPNGVAHHTANPGAKDPSFLCHPSTIRSHIAPLSSASGRDPSRRVSYSNGIPPPEGIPVFYVDPSRFIFTIKANRYLTHEIQLQCNTEEAHQHVSFFFNELCRALDPYLGPILIQLPPFFERSVEHVARLRRFYELLPKDEIILVYPDPTNDSSFPSSPSSAAAMPSTEATITPPPGRYTWEKRRRIRIAVEFRHGSWYHPETFRLFREFQWGIVVTDYLEIGNRSPSRNEESSRMRHGLGSTSDGGGHFVVPVDTGVPFLYCRFHGMVEKCAGDYGPALLQGWADRFTHFLGGVKEREERTTSATTGVSSPPHEMGNNLAEKREMEKVVSHQTGGTSSADAVEQEGKDARPCCFSSSFSTASQLYNASLSGTTSSEPYREVFCFFNNNDSHIQGVASSVVDGSCLAKLMRDRCVAPSSLASSGTMAPPMEVTPPFSCQLPLSYAVGEKDERKKENRKEGVDVEEALPEKTPNSSSHPPTRMEHLQRGRLLPSLFTRPALYPTAICEEKEAGERKRPRVLSPLHSKESLAAPLFIGRGDTHPSFTVESNDDDDVVSIRSSSDD